MAQGQMIKGQTPTKLNKDVQVDENGYIILSPSTTIAVTGAGGGNALASYYYVQKDTTDATYKYYGYMDASGAWVIKRVTRSNNLAEFVKGNATPTDFATAWAARAGNTYADYGSTF